MSLESFDFFNLDGNKGNNGGGGQFVNLGECCMALIGIGFLFFFLPAMLLSLVLTLVLHSYSKKKWERISCLLSGISLLLFMKLTSWTTLFQFGLLWGIISEQLVHLGEQFIQDGRPFELTLTSWCGLLLLCWCLTSVFLLLYRRLSKSWLTHEKEEEQRAFKESDKHFQIYKKKNDLLNKRQRSYRRSNDQRIYVGMNTHAVDIFLNLRSFFTHCFIQGTTGSGKTVMMYNILEGALRNGLGIVFVDGKGDPKTETEIRRIANYYGKKMYVFSDRTELHYNPVKYGKATAIKDRLMATLDWSESFYEKESENMLQMIINFLQDYTRKEAEDREKGVARSPFQGEYLRQDLKTIHRFLDLEELAIYLFYEQSEEIIAKSKVRNKDEGKAMEQIASEQKEVTIQSKTITEDCLHKKYIRYFFRKTELSFADIEEAQEAKGEIYKLIQGLRTQLELLIYSDLGEKFLEHEDPAMNLDIFSAIRDGQIVLFSLNSNDYSSFIKNIGRFLIADVAHAVTNLYAEANESRENGGKGTYKGGLGFFDEFGSYGSRKIIDIVSKARSADFGGVIGAQSTADLMTNEGDLTGQLIDNVNLFFMGRSNDPDHAEYTSRLAGTYEDIERTVVTENQGGIFHRFETQEARGTVRQVHKFVFDPDTVKELPNHTFLMVDKTRGELTATKEKVYARNAMADL